MGAVSSIFINLLNSSIRLERTRHQRKKKKLNQMMTISYKNVSLRHNDNNTKSDNDSNNNEHSDNCDVLKCFAAKFKVRVDIESINKKKTPQYEYQSIITIKHSE